MRNLETNETLSAYLDGELSNADRAAFEAELAEDADLRADLEQIQEAVAFLKTHGPARAPDDLYDDILAAVADEPMPSGGSWWDALKKPFGISLGGLTVAAAAVAVLLVALNPGSAPEGPAGVVGIDRPTPSAETPDNKAERKVAAQKPADDEPVQQQVDGWEAAGEDMDVPKQAPRPSPKAAPSSAPPSKEYATKDDVAATLPGTDEEEAESSEGTPAEGEGSFYRVPYSFMVQTDDPEVLLRLQRLVGRYKGQVVDGSKQPVKTSSIEPGYTDLYVEIPGSSMSAFQDELKKLGVVRRYDSDQGMYQGDVMIRVGIQLGDREGPKKMRSAPAMDEATESLE